MDPVYYIVAEAHSFISSISMFLRFWSPALKSLQREILPSSPGILFYNPISKIVGKHFLNLHQGLSSSFLAPLSIFPSWFAEFLNGRVSLSLITWLHITCYWGLRLLTWHWDNYLPLTPYHGQLNFPSLSFCFF